MSTLHAFVAGELIRDPERKTSSRGTEYTAALLRVDPETVVNLTCFDTTLADRLALLRKGAALACSGRLSAKPYTASDGALRPGLSVVVSELMTGAAPPQKATPKPRRDRSQPPVGAGGEPFDDDLPEF